MLVDKLLELATSSWLKLHRKLIEHNPKREKTQFEEDLPLSPVVSFAATFLHQFPFAPRYAPFRWSCDVDSASKWNNCDEIFRKQQIFPSTTTLCDNRHRCPFRSFLLPNFSFLLSQLVNFRFFELTYPVYLPVCFYSLLNAQGIAVQGENATYPRKGGGNVCARSITHREVTSDPFHAVSGPCVHLS